MHGALQGRLAKCLQHLLETAFNQGLFRDLCRIYVKEALAAGFQTLPNGPLTLNARARVRQRQRAAELGVGSVSDLSSSLAWGVGFGGSCLHSFSGLRTP